MAFENHIQYPRAITILHIKKIISYICCFFFINEYNELIAPAQEMTATAIRLKTKGTNSFPEPSPKRITNCKKSIAAIMINESIG